MFNFDYIIYKTETCLKELKEWFSSFTFTSGETDNSYTIVSLDESRKGTFEDIWLLNKIRNN